MRLDHIAYRVADRQKTAQFFIDAFRYKIQKEFPIPFDDGSIAQCIALEPPEKVRKDMPWIGNVPVYNPPVSCNHCGNVIPIITDRIYTEEYHLPPEIFVSDGTPDSIVGKWVAARDNIGGIHHLAYQVDDVRVKAKEWLDNGWGEFNGDVLTCPEDELEQIFTKPHPLTGVIYEFIKRGVHGFCEANVKSLMESTKENK